MKCRTKVSDQGDIAAARLWFCEQNTHLIPGENLVFVRKMKREKDLKVKFLRHR